MQPALIVVGTSLGGLNALKSFVSGLPQDFPLPVVVVQHRGKDQHDFLVKLVGERSALPVSEPEDKEHLAPGHVYIAPADYHVLIERGTVALSTEAPVNCARPSIDVLFETAADAYGAGVVAVVLTGAGEDGARGAARVRALSGMVVVQDPATAESGAMPAAAMKAAGVDRVLPLTEIPRFLEELCRPTENQKEKQTWPRTTE